ncbi:MAG: HAD family hydrolase [Acidimicrobiales bacterium]
MDRTSRAVMFDFFGTLVDYRPERSVHRYPRTHALAESWGLRLDHDAFRSTWDAASAMLEAESAMTGREFTMTQAAATFATSVGLELTGDRHAELGRSICTEWEAHVVAIPGAAAMLARIAAHRQVAVVSNTHSPDMVPRLMAALGFVPVDLMVLSVDHGWAKPHPSIFTAALRGLGTPAFRTVFVGDSFTADYVGPRACGIDAFLIDPGHRHDVPARHRLDSVLDLEGRLPGVR